MLWRNVIVLILVGTFGIVIGVGIAPGLDTVKESLSKSDSTPTVRELLIDETTGEICQQCHGTAGTKLGDTQVQFSAAPTSTSFDEPFSSERTSLTWHVFPGFSPDPMKAVSRSDAPDNDGWVGMVTNQTFGGFASLSYAGDENLSDYSVEAWIYTEVTSDQQGPLHGIAIRVDPKGERFYRLAAQFAAEPRLTLSYVGRDLNNFPIHLRTWGADEIPGGAPTMSGWHRMKLRAEGENIWAYWDDQELPGGPAIDSRISNGYFGVYANFVGASQVTQTFVDAIAVR